MTAARTLARTALLGGLAAGLAVPLSFGSAAVAAPPDVETFMLTCGNQTYEVWGNGNGEWTPVHEASSHRTFVPHSFTYFHGEVRDENGELVDSFDEPGEVQGSGKQKNDMSCTYTFSGVSDGSDPEFPEGYTFEGTGGVTGQLVGKR
jgi:hypothetical protein